MIAHSLNEAERSYVLHLAQRVPNVRQTREPPETAHNCVLAWNHSGHELFFAHLSYETPKDVERRPSMPRLFFLDPLTRALHSNWEELAEYRLEIYRPNGRSRRKALDRFRSAH